jgi:hypothetical protein
MYMRIENISLIVLVAIFISSLSACSYLNNKLGLEDDNLAEEVVEDVILGRTGVDIDLTPASPEK